MGVRQMELVNKFDNALAGVAGDSRHDRAVRQRRRTSSRPARSGTCRSAPPHEPAWTTTTQLTSVPAETPAQDELFGAIAKLAPRR